MKEQIKIVSAGGTKEYRRLGNPEAKSQQTWTLTVSLTGFPDGSRREEAFVNNFQSTLIDLTITRIPVYFFLYFILTHSYMNCIRAYVYIYIQVLLLNYIAAHEKSAAHHLTWSCVSAINRGVDLWIFF